MQSPEPQYEVPKLPDPRAVTGVRPRDAKVANPARKHDFPEGEFIGPEQKQRIYMVSARAWLMDISIESRKYLHPRRDAVANTYLTLPPATSPSSLLHILLSSPPTPVHYAHDPTLFHLQGGSCLLLHRWRHGPGCRVADKAQPRARGTGSTAPPLHECRPLPTRTHSICPSSSLQSVMIWVAHFSTC